MATAHDFRAELQAWFTQAERRGDAHVEIQARDLHRRVGGYPGPSHNMPGCCNVMRTEMTPNDVIVAEPPSGIGASLTIRYMLPRSGTDDSLGDTAPKKQSAPPTRSVSRGDAAGVPCLPIAKTLFVIQCSGGKRAGGSRNGDNHASVLNALPSDLEYELAACRAKVAREINVDEAVLLPAAERFTGLLYRAAGDALATLAQSGSHVLIISGGYGLVHQREQIGLYNQRFEASMWPDAIVGRCIAAYAAAIGATHVVGLFAKSGGYISAFRRTKTLWRDKVEQVFLTFPGVTDDPWHEVPRAQGEALHHLSHNCCLPANWRSSDGLGMNVERPK